MMNFQKLLKDEARLYYDEILAVVLDFHTKVYEQFLSKLNTLFQQADQDGDGVLTEDEFRSLIHMIQEE